LVAHPTIKPAVAIDDSHKKSRRVIPCFWVIQKGLYRISPHDFIAFPTSHPNRVKENYVLQDGIV
jgi:hypothetical protein